MPDLIEDMFVLEPWNVRKLVEQDAIGCEYLDFPGVSVNAINRQSDSELARYLTGLRNAALLPLSDWFHGCLSRIQARAETEARRRVQARQRAERYGYEDWHEYDLLAAVRAVTGDTGRKVGKEWVFRCPLGTHEDRNPSFQVNPGTKQWWCSCQSGGVVAWKKLMGG